MQSPTAATTCASRRRTTPATSSRRPRSPCSSTTPRRRRSASLAPGTPSNVPVTVSFSANDGAGSGVSVISYRVDGGSLQLGAAVIVPAPGDHSNDGSHLVEFFATDEVGNVETLKSVTVVIDTTAPSGSGGDPGDYLRGIATLSYATVCRRRQLGAVPVLARRRRRMVERRRSRHLAAVRGLVEHDARRRRPVRPARRRHGHDRQRRQHAPPRPAEDGRQHRAGRLGHGSCRRRLRLRRDRSRRERHRRRGPACVRRLGRPLRGQARRRRRVQRLRHADRSGRRLDLPADAGDDGARGRPRRAAGRRHGRRRQRDDLGHRARSTSTTTRPSSRSTTQVRPSAPAST